ncbi:hypothetical protein DMENIID0001_162080 [Sergentomyia squamirostris]
MLPLKTLRLCAVVPLLLLVLICDRTIVEGSRLGTLKRYEFGSPNYKLPPSEFGASRDPWLKYTQAGRPRRQLYPPHHDPFSSFFHSMSEGAKVVRHAMSDPFRRPKRYQYPHGKYIRGSQSLSNFYRPQPDFSTSTEFKGLEDFPNHDTHTEEHYHYDDSGKRIPPPPGFKFPTNLEASTSMNAYTTFPSSRKPDMIPENILRQIEKEEEQKAEDAMIKEFKVNYKEPKPKHVFTIKTTFKSPFDLATENGWIPMETGAASTLNNFKGFSGFEDLKAAGGEMTQSYPVSSLHTDVMNLPIGKQVHYEKRVIPLKDFVVKEILDTNTKKPKYTVYQFTKSSGSPTAKPLKETFGDDFFNSNSFFSSSSGALDTSGKKAVTTLAPIVIDTTSQNEIIVTPSPSSKPWKPSPSAEIYSVSSTWSSPTTRAPAPVRSSTRAPPRTTTRSPSRGMTTTEKPNYPDFFFETVHSDSGSSRKRQKERSRHKPTKSVPVDDIFKGSYSHYPTPNKFKPIGEQKLQLEADAQKAMFEVKQEEEKVMPSSTQDPFIDGFVKYQVNETPSTPIVEHEKPIKMKEQKKQTMKKLQASTVQMIHIQPKHVHTVTSPVTSPASLSIPVEKKRSTTTTTPLTPMKINFELHEKPRKSPSPSYTYSSATKESHVTSPKRPVKESQESRKRQRPHINYRDSSTPGSSHMERTLGRGSVKYGDKLR